MLIRLGQGEALHKAWRPLGDIASSLAEAVVAAEDNRFCEHGGSTGRRSRARSPPGAPARSRAAPARSRCRPPRTCSSGPTAACSERRSRCRSRCRSSFCGRSGGSSRSISTSSSSGPASTAPRPRRGAISASPPPLSAAREAALLAAVLPSPGSSSPARPSAWLEQPGAHHPQPHRPARPDAGMRAAYSRRPGLHAELLLDMIGEPHTERDDQQGWRTGPSGRENRAAGDVEIPDGMHLAVAIHHALTRVSAMRVPPIWWLASPRSSGHEESRHRQSSTSLARDRSARSPVREPPSSAERSFYRSRSIANRA